MCAGWWGVSSCLPLRRPRWPNVFGSGEITNDEGIRLLPTVRLDSGVGAHLTAGVGGGDVPLHSIVVAAFAGGAVIGVFTTRLIGVHASWISAGTLAFALVIFVSRPTLRGPTP